MKLKTFLLITALACCFSISTTTMSSCNVQLVPHKNPTISVMVQEVANLTDVLYSRMITSSDKSYSTYAADYKTIETEVDSLIAANVTRPKAGLILSQAQTFQTLFLRYEADHKARGTLNNGELASYRIYLRSAVRPWLVSENSLK